jgi:electron transfer flavoprotein beta subunit
MKAKKKPVTVYTSADLGMNPSASPGLRLESITPPPPRPECRFVDGDPEQAARELVRLLRDEANVI